MKKSELRQLVAKYKELKIKSKKKNFSSNHNLAEKLQEVKHRYFHETGRDIESDLK